ncbi:MAG TPA: GAF domain-containing sensor histidine kinase [Thermoleophilaceae bacterium]
MARGQARIGVDPGRLAEEQAALRRVATLVAEGAPPAGVFAVVAEQVAEVLGVPVCSVLRYEPDGTASERASFSPRGELFEVGRHWSLDGTNVVAQVLHTGRPARIDDYTGLEGTIVEQVRLAGINSTVGIPIVVAGRVWGAMVVSSDDRQPLPEETEARLQDFTELVATAIANSEARAEVERLADAQAALRRVATLVAQEAPREEVFTAITEELVRLLGVEGVRAARFEDDGTATVVGCWGEPHDVLQVGYRIPLEGDSATSIVARTGQTARIENYATARGEVGQVAREGGLRSAVAAPIVVEGRLWGAMVAASIQEQPLPPETESRLGEFTELMATAIANGEARAEVERLAEEQSALRRVATLVAEGAPPRAVFDAVATEAAQVLDAESVALSRYEGDDAVTVVAYQGSGAHRVRAGMRLPVDGQGVTRAVQQTGRPARFDDFAHAEGHIAQLARDLGVSSSVGAPIVVDGRLWGVIVASWTQGHVAPADAEPRLAQFAELLDTGIANADSRAQLMASRARMLAAGDDARRRVVRDLHDGAQQRLAHSIVTLKLAQRSLEENDARAETLLEEALDHAERGNAELRELAHGILPSVLTRGGLLAAVDALVSRVDLPVRTDVSCGRLTADVEASAYFIVAEALTNVVKHSRAENAEVRAFVDAGALRIEVRDDGVGGANLEGHGLVGIGDRVAALGGSVRIESPPDGGTLLAAALPLSG